MAKEKPPIIENLTNLRKSFNRYEDLQKEITGIELNKSFQGFTQQIKDKKKEAELLEEAIINYVLENPDSVINDEKESVFNFKLRKGLSLKVSEKEKESCKYKNALKDIEEKVIPELPGKHAEAIRKIIAKYTKKKFHHTLDKDEFIPAEPPFTP